MACLGALIIFFLLHQPLKMDKELRKQIKEFRERRMSDGREKIYKSGKVICGHCEEPMKMEGTEDERVYGSNGVFHFLCKTCRKSFPYDAVRGCNTTLLFYKDKKDGKIYNLYDGDKKIPIGEHRTIKKRMANVKKRIVDLFAPRYKHIREE